MGPDQTVEIMRRLLVEAMILGAPLLLGACAISLLVSLVQTLTGVQEQTLTAVPRSGGGVRRDHGGNAMDGAQAGEFHRAAVNRLSPVPGIANDWRGERTDQGLAAISDGSVAGDDKAEWADGFCSGVFFCCNFPTGKGWIRYCYDCVARSGCSCCSRCEAHARYVGDTRRVRGGLGVWAVAIADE